MDVDFEDDFVKVEIFGDEIFYLCSVVSEYLEIVIILDDVVYIYFGVCLFYDDGVVDVKVVMCDYVFELDVGDNKLVVFFVFGGKIIIYRKFVEYVFDKLNGFVLFKMGVWIVGVMLLGGDFLV